MKTKKQEELMNSFLSGFDTETEVSLYRDIALYLSELGYNPKKEKSSISFKHDLHNKQIAKMGIKTSKKIGVVPFFSLRFSACRGYSKRFADIVSENIIKYPAKVPRCTVGGCSFCKGEAYSHVYTCTFPSGENKSHCGAYALEIPNITIDDISAIEMLIHEEHDYLVKFEEMAK